MSKSNLFRVHLEDKILQGVQEVKFADFGAKERFDIQEWIEKTPEALGEELLIISKEGSYFEGTHERPDLIALDKSGNIVVIELKRDDAGQNIIGQAIKYASYYYQFKPNDIIKVYAKYLKKLDKTSEPDEYDANQRITEFVSDETVEDINVNQRIILVSHNFPKEVTSAANWLIEKNKMNIKCIRLIPYYDSDKEAYYLQSNEILPVAGVENIIITASGETKGGTTSNSPSREDVETSEFFKSIRNELAHLLDHDTLPDKYSRGAGKGPGFRYYHIWFNSAVWDNWGNSYKIWVYEKNQKYKDLIGKISVFLSISKKHLLTRGVTEENIKNLVKFLREKNLDGFELTEEKYDINLEGYVDNDKLSEKTMKEVNEKLVILIKATKPYIANLIKGT